MHPTTGHVYVLACYRCNQARGRRGSSEMLPAGLEPAPDLCGAAAGYENWADALAQMQPKNRREQPQQGVRVRR